MDKRQLQQIKNKTKIELEKELGDLRDKLWNLKKDLVSGRVKSIKEIRATKKSIAQVLTIWNKN